MLCDRCGKEPQKETYHAKQRKGRAHPVGSPGLHVVRMICNCGCKSVEFFHVLDYDKVRSHTTQTLLNSEYFDLRAESKKRGSVNGFA